jgi:hypothetical protein
VKIVQTELFAGYECVKVSNGRLELWVTRSVGPRIIGLSLNHAENLLAELPDASYTHADGRVYSFRGGHRLWIAPEVPEITYLPDDRPVQVEELPYGVQVLQPIDESTGLQKWMTITVSDDENRVEVEHKISNLGSLSLEAAAWALTQLRPGGLAILPQETKPSDPHGMQPNRSLALWPYTDVQSEHFSAGNRYLLVNSGFERGAFKVGFGNTRGWLAYLNQGTVFVKLAAYQPDKSYVDFGSSSQCYCNPSFLELETLSPLTNLDPGETISHRETWVVYDHIDLQPNPSEYEDQIDTLFSELAIQP